MKRKQKSYNTEQSILKEIDAIKAKQHQSQIEAENLEIKGHEFIRTGNKEDVEEGKWLLKKAGIARRKCDRCEGILLKLKDALAEFRTETFPMIIPDRLDRQVVLK